jgi:hypothetical protein
VALQEDLKSPTSSRFGETTVKNHISNILSKLGANDRARAVTLAPRRWIIELDLPKR